ncbi:sensor histidine kinase [Gorillibacterium massiliense]|uniref:sensor histidine kinase n=1 Tax=Gorillibacterium massiliense TaxID=1280390 RepID=UPI0004B94B93|nr:HAMP domain-containing sensor histidine kinase [Gorillibacterium massiliense]
MAIRTRLTLWYSGILAATLLLFGVAVYEIISYTLYENQREQLAKVEQIAETQISFVALETQGGTVLYPQMHELTDFRYAGYVMQLYKIDENKVYPLGKLQGPLSQLMTAHIVTDRNAFIKMKDLNGEDFYLYNKHLSYQYGDTPIQLVLQVGVSVNGISQGMKHLLYWLMLIAFLVIVIAASIGLFLSRKAFKPIEDVIESANLIQIDTDLGRRIDYVGPPDEIGRLTTTINGMLSRIQTMYGVLEESNRTQRRFVSDASHELRTPLTTIRGNVDLLQKVWSQPSDRGESPASTMSEDEVKELSLDAMKDISGEAERMSRMVNDLLSLARADAGQMIVKEPVELAPLVEEVVRNAERLPRHAEWRIGNLEPLHGVHVWGNADSLTQLLFILIENAFKYTPDGWVLIDTALVPGQVGIRVQDTGIGLDNEEIPHVFDRFYRADPSRGATAGTGLGLSIAKWIIDDHGGSIEVVSRKDEGSAFVIWLPIHGRIQGFEE